MLHTMSAVSLVSAGAVGVAALATDAMDERFGKPRILSVNSFECITFILWKTRTVAWPRLPRQLS